MMRILDQVLIYRPVNVLNYIIMILMLVILHAIEIVMKFFTVLVLILLKIVVVKTAMKFIMDLKIYMKCVSLIVAIISLLT
jgi:hypothetical protein